VYALNQLDINSVLDQHIIITPATLLIRLLQHAWNRTAALTLHILPTLAANRAVDLNLRKLSLADAPVSKLWLVVADTALIVVGSQFGQLL